jgi:hypothetical protein
MILKRCSRGVHRVGDLIKLIGHQVPVQIEGHRGGLVAEHCLHDLDVRAGRDGEAGCGVAQCVWCQAVETGRPHGRVEALAPEVA